jgi:hypothetical protein
LLLFSVELWAPFLKHFQRNLKNEVKQREIAVVVHWWVVLQALF